MYPITLCDAVIWHLLLLAKRNTLILYSYFHQMFMFLLLVSVKVSQLSKPRVSDFGTNMAAHKNLVKLYK